MKAKDTHHLELNMILMSSLFFFYYFEILLAPIKLLLPSAKKLPGKAELVWQATLKGLVEFQNKKETRPLFTIILTQKWWFQDLRF